MKNRPRIKRIKKSTDIRIFDTLRAVYGTYKAEKKYRYIMLKTELGTLNAL